MSVIKGGHVMKSIGGLRFREGRIKTYLVAYHCHFVRKKKMYENLVSMYLM